MTYCRAVLVLFGVSLVSWLAGCNSGGSLQSITPPSKPISVLFLGAPPAEMAVNASATFSVGVVNANESVVTLSVSCASAGACGSFNSNIGLSSSPITYTAPSTIPSGGSVTVTATSAVDTTKSVSAVITIVPPIPISVSLYGSIPASMQVNSTVPVRAFIANDVSANPHMQWTASCGGAVCGSFNPATTTSEAATNFTAPASLPAGNSVTVTATSVTDPTKSVSTNIVILPTAPTLADGTYVFQMSGPVGMQASFVTGVLVAKGGVITGGEQDSASYTSDSNDDLVPDPQFQQISGGSYATAPDGSLQISINVGQFETEKLNGVLTMGANGFVAQLYGAIGSGTLELQTSTAAPAGGYAFSTYGGDRYSQTVWIGGVLNIDGAGTISGNGSVADIVNGGGASAGKETLGAGTVSTPDKFGRVMFQLAPGTILPSLYLAGYVVDVGHVRLTETAGDNFMGVLGGVALGQGTSTGNFSSSSIAGSSYVFGLSGYDRTGTVQVAGVFTANASGGVSGTLNWNDQTGTKAQSPIAFTGSYTVDPSGRVTLSNLTDGSTFNYTLHLYLTGNGGLVLSSDNADTMAGQAFRQQTGAFTATSFSGNYGLNGGQVVNLGAKSNVVIGSVAAVAGSGTSTVAGFANSGNGAASFAVSGSFVAASNGVFTGSMTGFNAASSATTDSFTLYLVDGTRGVLIETDSTQLTLGNLQLQ